MECDVIEDHATTNPRVTVSGGILEGTIETGSGVRSFKGIPFAAPPVADLRWCPPRPAPPWVGMCHAISHLKTERQRSDALLRNPMDTGRWRMLAKKRLVFKIAHYRK